MSDVAADQHWKLDKRVPLELILASVAQTAAGVWWAATVSTRVDVAERRVAILETNDIKLSDTAQRAAEALAAIRASQDAMRAQLDRIEQRADRK